MSTSGFGYSLSNPPACHELTYPLDIRNRPRYVAACFQVRAHGQAYLLERRWNHVSLGGRLQHEGGAASQGHDDQSLTLIVLTTTVSQSAIALR